MNRGALGNRSKPARSFVTTRPTFQPAPAIKHPNRNYVSYSDVQLTQNTSLGRPFGVRESLPVFHATSSVVNRSKQKLPSIAPSFVSAPKETPSVAIYQKEKPKIQTIASKQAKAWSALTNHPNKVLHDDKEREPSKPRAQQTTRSQPTSGFKNYLMSYVSNQSTAPGLLGQVETRPGSRFGNRSRLRAELLKSNPEVIVLDDGKTF